MQSRYDDPVPNPERFTPQRPIRVDDEAWEKYGQIVGERKRSEDIKAYITWRLANPTADLSAVPDEQVLDFLVRVRLAASGRAVDVVELPGATGAQVERLKGEIRQAVVDYLGKSEPTKRGRDRREQQA